VSKTNLADAPKCAIHKAGKGDPEGCKPPIPTFWLCDTKDAADSECIRVMGWASNFAQIHDAIEQFDKQKNKTGKDKEPFMDEFWGVPRPGSAPREGREDHHQGRLRDDLHEGDLGHRGRPIMGVMTYNETSRNEAAPELATLPGMKRK